MRDRYHFRHSCSGTGGVILLGRAPTSWLPAGSRYIEGFDGYSNGGTDPNDSSGTLRYVRVRNARRGLALLGVGNATTVDHCEVAFNVDDGFEVSP